MASNPYPHLLRGSKSSKSSSEDYDDDEDTGLEYDLDDIDAVADAEEQQKRASRPTMDREAVLQSLGYKSGKVRHGSGNILDKSDLCHRCGKKVYPVEKMDIGMLYHRGCFKCRVCSITLTLRNFQRGPDVKSDKAKEIYCKNHIPRLAHGGIDKDALEIKQALESQKNVKKAAHELDPYHYDASSALEYEHFRQLQNIKLQKKLKRHSSLRNYQDFEEHGVFEAQTALEAVHREEEDELYQQMYEERKQRLHDLQRDIESEKQKTVKELISWFEKKGVSKEERQIGLKKIEQFYKEKREQRTQLLLQELAAEEQAAVSRMIEKHSQEMLQLIANKNNEAEETLKRQNKHMNPADQERIRQRMEPSDDHSEQPDIEIDVEVLPDGELVISKPRYHSRESSLDNSIERNLDCLHEVEENEAVEDEEEEEVEEVEEPEEEPEEEEEEFREEEEKPKPEEVEPEVLDDEEKEERQEQENLANEMKAMQERLLAKMRKQPVYQKYGDPPKVETASPKSSPKIEKRKTNEKKATEVKVKQSPKSPKATRPKKAEKAKDDSFVFEDQAMPAIEPPKLRKANLYKNPDVFKEVDDLAIREAQKDHATFTDLVKKLSVRCQTELQRVRSIFRWVTVKDLNRMKFDDSMNPDSPLGLLRGIKLGKESYHNLFKRLCSYAGLHCEIIEGCSKGAGYRPGARFKGDFFRNQWTAVWVEGSWRFINCNWGARHVKGPKDDLMTYKCDEFYFLTDSEEQIYQHFPDDEKWQLLKRPISMKEFVKMPIVKSPFFNNKLSFTEHMESILKTNTGLIEIRLLTPKLMSFAAKLKSRDKRIPSDLLRDRTLVRTISNEVIFTVNLPSPGAFYLELFASSRWGSESMDNICAFQLKCSSVLRDAHMTFPQIGCFGRTPRFHKYGLAEQMMYDPYQVTKGEFTVGFTLTKDPELKLFHGLKYWSHRDRKTVEFDQHAMLRLRTDDSAFFTLHFPKKGHYIFLLYAATSATPTNEMECVFRYLVNCTSAAKNPAPFPRTSKRWRHCKLIEPLTGEMTTQTKVRFIVDSSLAQELVVSLNGKWFELKRRQDTNLWQGEVYTGDKAGKATLFGRFDPTQEKYIPMLEYHVREATVADEVRRLYQYI